jgi:hypothetical protein
VKQPRSGGIKKPDNSVKNDVYFVTKGYSREANNRDQYPFLCCIEATIEPK